MTLTAGVAPGRQGKLYLSLPASDLLDHDFDRVAEPEDAAAAPAGEGGAEGVQLEVVAMQAADRQVTLEDAAEADEQSGRDHAGDLPRPRLVPAPVEELRLEQPGEADVVGEVLQLGRLALAGRCVFCQVAQMLRERLVGGSELAKQCAVDDEVGVAPDRAREMGVRRAREP